MRVFLNADYAICTIRDLRMKKLFCKPKSDLLFGWIIKFNFVAVVGCTVGIEFSIQNFTRLIDLM